MSSVNVHTIVGSVGTINELKGSTEMPVLSFSVATSDYAGKGKGDARDGSPTDYSTTWHDVSAFGKLAGSLATRMAKGDQVYVSGPLVKETYQKKDGTGSATSARIKADKVTILNSKAGKTTSTTSDTSNPMEIPF